MEREAFKIGEKMPDEKPSVFLLVVEDLVDNVKPKSYGISSEKGIDPNEYFITSGDAVEKAKVLSKDMWKYAGELRKRVLDILAKENNCTTKKAQQLYQKGKRPVKPKRIGDYEAAVWKAAGQSRKLLNELTKAKGEDCFLETEWDDHNLYCIPKNPRSKGEE